MQSKAQRVVVLGTGGTIAGVAATPEDDLDYVAGLVGVGDLVTAARGIADIADIAGVVVETEQLAQRDSKDMDFATWRRLALRIASHAARPEVAGVVVTHGTDTLEETAYFLSRVLAVTKPVVLTAAMRPATSAQADGPRNLADAIAVASRSEITGVVVVIAGEVHAARDVRKAHTHRLAAFTSGERGPMARIEGGHATLLRAVVDAEAQALAIERLPAEDGAWPWVEIAMPAPTAAPSRRCGSPASTASSSLRPATAPCTRGCSMRCTWPKRTAPRSCEARVAWTAASSTTPARCSRRPPT